MEEKEDLLGRRGPLGSRGDVLKLPNILYSKSNPPLDQYIYYYSCGLDFMYCSLAPSSSIKGKCYCVTHIKVNQLTGAGLYSQH